MSRWVELYATSPSGKTLFVCRFCGRISPTPDKVCISLPSVVAYKLALPCETLEEIEACVREATDSVPLDERENKTNYVITLTSPRSASIEWTNGRGKAKRSHVTINSLVIDDMCTRVREFIAERTSRAEEPSELKRRHL